MLGLQARWLRWAAIMVFALALIPTVAFGMRTYRSFQLLQSAYAAGAPENPPS